ncbi:MAG: pitrilysin family protein [Bacteroidales bacterium]|nr:pitrilysin family protein [Bacteroidales bacterium]
MTNFGRLSKMNVGRFCLDNGLRVVHVEMPSTRMVALNMLFDVGSRDENPELTGIAHLLEHLMFCGTADIPNYDDVAQNAGALTNAWTNTDVTNYYITLPYQNVETAFCLESNRMCSLNLQPQSLRIQRQVVMEEFKQNTLNKPFGQAFQHLRSLAYTTHPYRWPTIGKNLEHINRISLADVEDFYTSHYAPNNAILAVVGHIGLQEVQRLAAKWFAHLPMGKVPERRLPRELPQHEKRTSTLHESTPTEALYMAFHIGSRSDPRFHVFDLMSDVLGGGASNRLREHLVYKSGMALHTNCFIDYSLDPGLFYISGKPAPGVALAELEEAVWHELQALSAQPIGHDEFRRVKNQFESRYVFDNLNHLNAATNLAFYELLGDVDQVNRQVERYENVTAGQVLQAASECLVENNCSLVAYSNEPE